MHETVDGVKDEVPVLGGDLSDGQFEQSVKNQVNQTVAEQKHRKVAMKVEHTSHNEGANRSGTFKG